MDELQSKNPGNRAKTHFLPIPPKGRSRRRSRFDQAASGESRYGPENRSDRLKGEPRQHEPPAGFRGNALRDD